MRLSICCLFILSLGALSHAASADIIERIRTRGHLLVAVKNEGNPDRAAHKDPAHFNKRDFEVELARAIAAKLLGDPAKVEFVMVKKPERVPAVANGKVDLAISMLRPNGRSRAQVDFSQPYYEASVAVMQTTGGTIANPEQLAGRRIGVIARNEDAPPALLAPAQIVEYASFDRAAAALATAEIDALFSAGANIDVYLKTHPGQFVCSPPLETGPVAIAVPKDAPALLATVNAVIDELRASGRLDAMQRKHGLR